MKNTIVLNQIITLHLIDHLWRYVARTGFEPVLPP